MSEIHDSILYGSRASMVISAFDHRQSDGEVFDQPGTGGKRPRQWERRTRFMDNGRKIDHGERMAMPTAVLPRSRRHEAPGGLVLTVTFWAPPWVMVAQPGSRRKARSPIGRSAIIVAFIAKKHTSALPIRPRKGVRGKADKENG